MKMLFRKTRFVSS